jgi:heme/copper-type cytochrome/quinol oxidase subunit 2
MPSSPRPAWSLARQVLAVSLLLPTLILLGTSGPAILAVPPVVVFLALHLVAAAFFFWKGDRWSALLGGIALFAFAAMNLPFIGPELVRPDHGAIFAVGHSAILVGVAGLVSGIAVFREARAGVSPPPRWGAPGAMFALVAVGAMLGVGFTGFAASYIPSPGAGSVALTPEATVDVTIEDFAYSPATVSIPADKIVRIRVTNEDRELHTFSVDGLSLAADVPPGKTAEIWVKTDKAGDYQIYCKPHSEGGETREGMTATLTVA